MNPHDSWPELRGVRQPAKFWRVMVSKEPCLAQFEIPTRSFGMRGLVDRLTLINATIADRGRPNRDSEGRLQRGGFEFHEAERLEAIVADALAIIYEMASRRTYPSTEPVLAIETVTICAACWRLTPITTRRGFRPMTGTGALCDLHSPAVCRSNTTPLAAAKRRMRQIEKISAPIDGSAPEIQKWFREGLARRRKATWAAYIDRFFTHVSVAHPKSRSNILAAFQDLDQPQGGVERQQLYEALAASPWGAGLLHAMLTTRELWLKVESENFHGGRRHGAGRPRTNSGETSETAVTPSIAP